MNGSDCATNLTWCASSVSSQERNEFFSQKPATLWLTGLSGAGKSTIAREFERQLIHAGHAVFVIDGDNLRQGLCKNLGFSPGDRSENIRRAAEVCKLLNEAGMLVIASFVAPYRADRAMAREIVGADQFIEVYVSTSLHVCEERDPKGLYKKARAGEIPNFTGVSAPFEEPLQPDLVLDTHRLSIDDSVAYLWQVTEPYFVQH